MQNRIYDWLHADHTRTILLASEHFGITGDEVRVLYKAEKQAMEMKK